MFQARTLASIAILRDHQLDAARELAQWSDRAARLRSDLGRFPVRGSQDPGAPVQQAARILDAIADASDQGVHWDSLRFAHDARSRPATQAVSTQGSADTLSSGERAAPAQVPRKWDLEAGRDNARNLAELFHPLPLSPGVSTLQVMLGGQYLGIEGLCAHIAHLRSLGAAVVDLSLDGNRVDVGLTLLARTQP